MERYLCALTGLSRVFGLTGEEFRRVPLKTKVMRIVVVNEGRILGSMSGAKATVGRGYDIVTEPYRGVSPVCATRWSCFGAECCPDPQCSGGWSCWRRWGARGWGEAGKMRMVSLPRSEREGPKMLDCLGAWGRSIWLGSFTRETITTRPKAKGDNVKAVSQWKVACALECDARADTGPDRRHDR